MEYKHVCTSLRLASKNPWGSRHATTHFLVNSSTSCEFLALNIMGLLVKIFLPQNSCYVSTNFLKLQACYHFILHSCLLPTSLPKLWY